MGIKPRQPSGCLWFLAIRNTKAGQRRLWLMADPAVYLIDEPTAGVDPKTSETIYDLIDELARRRGKAILLVDQDIKSALAISDYVYVVKTGTIVSQGPRDHFGGDVDDLVARWLHASGDRDNTAPA